jgi:ABC-type glycerol-3-phosphate transport system substrate-binding protein
MGTMLSAVMLATAACGSGGNEGAAKVGEPAKGADANVKREPVEITFYRPNTATTEDQFMDLIGNAVKAKFPYVTPRYIPFGTGTGVNELISSGQSLDVILLSIGFYPQYQKINLMTDLTEQIKKTKYDESRLESTTYDFVKKSGNGKIESLPIFTTAEVLMYNKDLFDKFAVPYPKEGMTWDDLYELSRKISRNEGGVQYYGFLPSVSHMLNTNQLSLPYIDPKTNQPTMNTEKYKQMSQNIARFYNIPNALVPKEKHGKEADMFVKERSLAMYGYFNSTMVNAPADMNLDAVPFPSYKEAPGVGSQMYPTFASVGGSSKHKDVAFEILAFLTSDEMQLKFAKDGTGMPIVKNSKALDSFGIDKSTLKGKNIKAFYPAKPAAISTRTLYDDIAAKHAVNAIREVAQNVSDVNTAFRKAEELAIKDIEAELKK